MRKSRNRIGKILIVLGVVFGLLGIRSFWRDYTYRKASIAVKAEVLSADVKDIRIKYGNYYLKPTHRTRQLLAFLRDGAIDTLTDENLFVMYSREKNPNPVPAVEQLMREKKYVRYVPESKKSETAFPDRIDVNGNGKDEGQYLLSHFVYMTFCFVTGGILSRLFRIKNQ